MFSWFKKKKQTTPLKTPQLADINGNPLQIGDSVEVLRYEFGNAVLVKENDQYYYKAVSSGEKISWLKLIDASTTFQKVRKISQ